MYPFWAFGKIKINEKEPEYMLILASGSPRRKEILEGLGADFRVVVADTDESSDERNPVKLTQELARRKGRAVYEKLCVTDRAKADDSVIISADTVVCLGGEILGKPHDRADAMRMVRSLSGRDHIVVSGVAITIGGISHSDACVTTVHVNEIPEEEIEKYVDSKDPMDKAGGYGIQGRFSLWIRGIDGCYFSVVGLPVNTLQRLYFECTGKRLV